MSEEKKKILYVRSGPYKPNINGYNLQEIGLAIAFCKKGYDVDILYYSEKNEIQKLAVNNGNVRILWSKGIRLLRSGVYPRILKKEFLNNYDVVIASEYSQIMSILLASRHKNVFIYNGPYYNLFKLPFLESIYDKLFVNYINNHVKKVYCKTLMAEKYLNNKGITNTITVGVGLNVANYLDNVDISRRTQELIDNMKGYRNILYVGSISDRKNVKHIIKSFIQYKKENCSSSNVKLVLVGNGKKNYIRECKELIPEKLEESILWEKDINNFELKYVYKMADVFMLASKKEIFGMVLLEAMYFGIPIITSMTAGASMLIENGKNGYILSDFDTKKWVNKLRIILSNSDLRQRFGQRSKELVNTKFSWLNIANKMEQFF